MISKFLLKKVNSFVKIIAKINCIKLFWMKKFECFNWRDVEMNSVFF